MTMHSIRSVLKSELNGVYRLEQAIFGEHCYPDFFFRQGFDCWGESFYVAVDEQGALLGYVLCAPSHEPAKMWILSLAVSEQARGQGIGKQLIQYCLTHLAPGIKSVYLTVDPANPAHGLYQRLGFVDVGFEAAYFGEGADRVVMCYQRA